MDEFKERLKRLKEQRKKASQSNFMEVLEENERKKKPANWDKQVERAQKRVEEEDAKQRAEEAGQDYELAKSLNYQADEIEKWENRKGKKRPATSSLNYKTTTQPGVERMVETVNKDIETRAKKSRRRRFDDEADVNYINERNMRFNQKLERFYGGYTDEIKKNLERGTAI